MWRERIQAAKQRGTFTRQDQLDAGCIGSLTAYRLCAVGEQAERYGASLIFDYPMERVSDPILMGLGARFAGMVSVNDFARAECLLDQIEDRALELKRQAPVDAHRAGVKP